MTKVIEHFLLPLFFVMSVLYAFNSFGNHIIELKKIFHHKAGNLAHIDRGKLSLYFSHDPEIKEIHAANKASGCQGYQSYFFPNVTVSSDECEEMIERINSYNDCYSIKIEKVVSSQPGLKITFGCDARTLGLRYEVFDSIGLQKGVVFCLYSKDVINQLQQKNNQPLLRTLHQKGRPRIAIDPGHGGGDSGAIGCAGIKEKDVCLSISTSVAHLLQQNGCSVVLTRSDDSGLFLDERTLCANKNNVDLFVSIHANYAANSNAQGIETFCVQPHLFCSRLSNLSDNENDIVTRAMSRKADGSYQLAQLIQNNICTIIAQNHKAPVDRKVKFSVSQVLLGTHMPSVLVEVGFLSHNEESHLLCSKDYQKLIAQGISNGVMSFVPF